MDRELLFARAEDYREELVALRRDFHKYAESGWAEYRTTAKIIQHLRAHGLEPKFGPGVLNLDHAWAYPGEDTVRGHMARAVEQGADPVLVEQMQGGTGAVAVIETGRPGPTIALRVDIDCNDLEECKDPDHRPVREGFASVNPNMMHACGHDGHAAIGLVTAALLQEYKDQLRGTIKVIFQPAEEGDRGALAMVHAGVLDDVDVVLGAHIFHSDEGNGLGGTQTGLYATTKFDVEIRGQASHAGAAPQDGRSAISAACLAVVGMQGFLQDGRGCGRLNVGTIQGGTGRNVTPDRCFMRLETRGSTTEVEQRIYNSAQNTIAGACQAFGCTYTNRIMGICPTGDGDLDLAEVLVRGAEDIPDFLHRRANAVQTGGTDDFSCMIEKVRGQGGKACYMALFTTLASGGHTVRYDFDESILTAGVKAFLSAVDVLTR